MELKRRPLDRRIEFSIAHHSPSHQTAKREIVFQQDPEVGGTQGEDLSTHHNIIDNEGSTTFEDNDDSIYPLHHQYKSTTSNTTATLPVPPLIPGLNHRYTNHTFRGSLDDEDNTNFDERYSPSSSSPLEYDHDHPIGRFRSIQYWWYRQYEQYYVKYMYPPSSTSSSAIPRECQIYRIELVAIPTCYLLVGLLQGLSSPLLNVLPMDLHATEAQQVTILSIRGVPASLKLVFGFLSDTIPLMGYRRKSYMILGWLITSLSLLYLLWVSNFDFPRRSTGCFGTASSSFDNNLNTSTVLLDTTTTHDTNITTPQLERDLGAAAIDATSSNGLQPPSMEFLSICLLWFGTGYWMADVMGDSIVAERARYEPLHLRGSIQSTCYACRFFGKMIAAPYATYLYSYYGPASIIRLLIALPLVLGIPTCLWYHEPRYKPVRPVREQCNEIWTTVCSRSVWQPMGFIYLYNLFQVSNGAWKEYLVTVLHFTSCQLNFLLIMAYVLLYIGIVTYKYYFIQYSWRTIYIVTTFLNGFVSIFQVLLLKGITFGLNPFWFTLGDDAIIDFISGIQFLPTTIMMVHLCPEGSEGASYAMFTTMNNSALTVSSMISTQLLKIWDVTKTAFEAGNIAGMINLTYLTTAIQLSALLFVGLLPRYKDDLIALGTANNNNKGHASSMNAYATSKIGGFVFLTVTFGSIVYAVVIGYTNIVVSKS